jgi:uncharacterized protein
VGKVAKHVLFIHGGGDGAYDGDLPLAASLRDALWPEYAVRFPRMPDEAEPDYDVWASIIGQELAAMGSGAVLAGHSIGASVIIRAIVDGRIRQSLAGVFLLSAPFWHEHDFWCWKEVQLPADAAERVPDGLPVFLYHGRDDEAVPFSHVEMYARALPQAAVRPLDGRDHQLNEDLTEVAREIMLLR